MEVTKIKTDLIEKMKVGFTKARNKLIAEKKKNNGYLIITNEKGNIKKVPAKGL